MRVPEVDILISKLADLESDFLQVAEEQVRANEHILIDMNAEDQLFQRGVNAFGVPISSYDDYQPRTIEIKQQKGQPTDRVTLRDEGDFHKSFFIEFISGAFGISAKDKKADKLVSRYREEILGLTDENFAEFALDYVEPAVSEFIKKKLL